MGVGLSLGPLLLLDLEVFFLQGAMLLVELGQRALPRLLLLGDLLKLGRLGPLLLPEIAQDALKLRDLRLRLGLGFLRAGVLILKCELAGAQLQVLGQELVALRGEVLERLGEVVALGS